MDEGLLRRLLLRGLLRPPLPAPELLAVDDGGAREHPLVRRAVHLDDRVAHLPAEARERLLQLGLVVDMGRQGVLDPVRERADDGVLDGGEAVLEEERAEDRLEEGSQDIAVLRERGDVLALVELGELGAKVELVRDDGAARPRDDVRTDLRQPSLGKVGMPRVQRVGDRQLEDAVPEEFQALVRGGPVDRPGRVREGSRRRLARQRVDQPGELYSLIGATRRSRPPGRRS